ncbi:uncharacterized protein LOC117172121 isoform X1 [Belonocnema kinseyi]|uniref:uncharacterized protein LOC117172121 isoform X1 n=1 Tax=Belonocnema kinseyi TaxID=2817044 RepID=UPI00143CF32E|nr:uncharacterized protein LOC117172121 isoform X1 [Belonocnema kinseyi]
MKDLEKGKKIEEKNKLQEDGGYSEQVGLDIMKKAERRKIKKYLNEEKKKNIFKSTTDLYETPLRWWEKEPVKYAISHPTVRSRLETLMGSNVVRLTDRKYMLKLMSKIREDHETKQQNRIEERKKRELKRMKTMILNRLIPVQEAPEDIKQYPIFQLYLYCDAIKNAKRKRRSRKMVRIRESLYQLLYPREKGTESAEDDAEEELCMKRIKVNEETQLVPLTPEEVTTYLKEQEELKDIEDGYILNQEEFDRLHYETDAVKHLREAQTVEEMYAEAHAIVRILYSYADEGRYTKTEGKDENEETSEDGEENEGENETED